MVSTAPTSVPPATASSPASSGAFKVNTPTAALFDAAAETADVRAVNSDPANDVTRPAPDPARVIASPPLLVTTVYADPPMPSKRRKNTESNIHQKY